MLHRCWQEPSNESFVFIHYYGKQSNSVRQLHMHTLYIKRTTQVFGCVVHCAFVYLYLTVSFDISLYFIMYGICRAILLLQLILVFYVILWLLIFIFILL